jgi:hypothetical protein
VELEIFQASKWIGYVVVEFVSHRELEVERLVPQKLGQHIVPNEMDHNRQNRRNVRLRGPAVQTQSKECFQRFFVAARRRPSYFVVIHTLLARLLINFFA